LGSGFDIQDIQYQDTKLGSGIGLREPRSWSLQGARKKTDFIIRSPKNNFRHIGYNYIGIKNFGSLTLSTQVCEVKAAPCRRRTDRPEGTTSAGGSAVCTQSVRSTTVKLQQSISQLQLSVPVIYKRDKEQQSISQPQLIKWQ
jgi:hypothetical protein